MLTVKTWDEARWRKQNFNPFITTLTALIGLLHVGDGARALLLQARRIPGALGFFMVDFQAVVCQLPLLSSLIHVVGPLRAAAASLSVHEAASASGEGAAASAPVINPGFLSIAIIVLKG